MCALALAFVDFCTTNQGSFSYFVYVLATGDVTSQFYIIYIKLPGLHLVSKGFNGISILKNMYSICFDLKHCFPSTTVFICFPYSRGSVHLAAVQDRGSLASVSSVWGPGSVGVTLDWTWSWDWNWIWTAVEPWFLNWAAFLASSAGSFFVSLLQARIQSMKQSMVQSLNLEDYEDVETLNHASQQWVEGGTLAVLMQLSFHLFLPLVFGCILLFGHCWKWILLEVVWKL